MIKIVGDFKLIQDLGEGNIGKVYKAINKVNGKTVEIKVINKTYFTQDPNLENLITNQIGILNIFKADTNPYLCSFIEMLKTQNNYYFVYEYFNGLTLQNIIQNHKDTPTGVIPIQLTLKYFGELLEAFKILVIYNIMIRDLNPNNILTHNGVLKITNFTHAKRLLNPTDIVESTETIIGYKMYKAPEVIRKENYNMKADIWSLGVVLYEMVYGCLPFAAKSVDELIHLFANQQVKYPSGIPKPIENILKRMLVKDPTSRIDWQQLFKYKIVSGELIEPINS